MVSERAVEITETYSPNGRTVVVAGIPAIEVIVDDVSDVVFELGVSDRLDELIERALRSSDAVEQRITYSASDARGGRRVPEAARRTRRASRP